MSKYFKGCRTQCVRTNTDTRRCEVYWSSLLKDGNILGLGKTIDSDEVWVVGRLGLSHKIEMN